MAGALVRHVRDHVRYVVVDEYQDTNPIQEQLIERLCRFGANLCVVGDDDQTIYQWRGSAVSNILSFTERQEDVRKVTLDDNFRSSPGIVALGREVAARNDPDRLAKNMVAAGHQTYERGDMLALTFDSAADEAAWICDRIERLRGVPFMDSPGAQPRGLSWSDFAVLFRSVSKDAGELVDELRRRSIPYVIKGLTRLFDAPEVQACVACFQYVLHEVTADDVVNAWLGADVGVTREAWRRRCRSWRKRGTGSRASGGARTTSSAPTCGSSRPSSIREETVAVGAARTGPRPRRACLLQPRQVQPGDLRLRADLLPVRPAGASTTRS